MKRDRDIHFKINQAEQDDMIEALKILNHQLKAMGCPPITSYHKGWYHLALLGIKKLREGANRGRSVTP